MMDPGIKMSRIRKGLVLLLSKSAIVGSVGMGSTDDVALTRNSSSRP